jgi:putative ABC transport system permease protein
MKMLEILRNLARRKLRSALTISGIVIGIFALTTMGSLAEHFNSELDLGVKFFGTSIKVGPPDGQQVALLPLSKMTEIKQVAGVAAVVPAYQIAATPGGAEISFGPPNLITNENPDAATYTGVTNSFVKGHDLDRGAGGEVVLGATIASSLKAAVGQTLDLPVKPKDAQPTFLNHPFTVVGVLAATGNGLDSLAYVADADARMLLRDSLPPALRNGLDPTQVAQGFTVYAAPGTSLAAMDAIAQRINDQVPGVKASQPSALVENFKSTGTLFTTVMTGAAILALIIGGLSVVNTMIMAVTERVREIGLKKAVGAHTRHILREFLLEATLIGAIGGSVGYLLGFGLVTLMNAAGQSSNTQLFLVTPRLTALALGFAVGMATLAGIVPALRAARLDPVSALRNN